MKAPRFHLAPADRQRIREVSGAAWPHEACGLLEGVAEPHRIVVRRLHVLANVHRDPRRRYTIDPESWLRLEHAARAAGGTIIGVWHSHPHGDARPSDCDRAQAWPGWSYLIAGVTNAGMEELRCWRIRDNDFEELPVSSPEVCR